MLAPALRDRYDLSLTQIGVVLAAEWIGLTLALLPWGFAVDRYGERLDARGRARRLRRLLVGAAFASGFAALFVLLGLAGAAGGSVQTGSGRAVMGWFGPDERGLALGVRQTAVPLGGAVAALVLPQLGGGPRPAFLFLAALVLAGAIGGCARAPRRRGARARAGGRRSRRSATVVSGSRAGRAALYLVAQLALTGFVVLFLHDERGLSDGAAAAVLAAPRCSPAALRIALGRWSDVAALSRPAAAARSAPASRSPSASRGVASTRRSRCSCRRSSLATAISMAWNGLSFTPRPSSAGRRGAAPRSASSRRCSR